MMLLAASRSAARSRPVLAGHTRTRPQTRTMVVKEGSSELAMGAVAPSFQLPEPLTSKSVSLDDVKGPKGTVVMIICNHCPFVVLLKEGLTKIAQDYAGHGIGFVAISSNSAQTHPQDGPDAMAQDARTQNYPFPYLYDETQDVAKAYFAMCTPDFYAFDGDLRLKYHGRFDDARPGKNVAVTGKDLRAALDALVSGTAVPASRPSIGCSLKWHPGKQPDYF